MVISALSNPGLLSFASNANLLTPSSSGATVQIDQGHIQLLAMVNTAQASSASSSSSAQLAPDTYTPSSTPSSQSAQSDTSFYSQADVWASSTGISKTTMEAMFDAVANFNETPVQSSWNSLSTNLASGDISAAQASLTNFTNSLADSNLTMSSLTTPSAAFTNDLASMAKALSAGNLTDAKAAFTAANGKDGLTDIATAMGLALGQAEIDGGMTAQGVQNADKNNTSFTINTSQLAGDIKNIDDLNREVSATITDYLVSKGFSASDATAYATATTSISNGSSADNAATDTTRTAAWVNALTNYAQNGSTPSIFNSESKGDVWHQEGQSNPMFAAITGIVYAESIAVWNEAHPVTDQTTGTNGASASGNADGQSSSSASVSA